jgi:hypothetical protein
LPGRISVKNIFRTVFGAANQRYQEALELRKQQKSNVIFDRGDRNYQAVLRDKQNGTFRYFNEEEMDAVNAAADQRFEQALAERTARLGPLEIHCCVSCRFTVSNYHHQEFVKMGWILNLEGKDYCSAPVCNSKGLRAKAIEEAALKAGHDDSIVDYPHMASSAA